VLASLLAGSTAGAGGKPFRVRFTPFDVDPGRDRLTCEYVALPNAAALDVARFLQPVSE
jgi:hypothetical protein